MPLPPPRPFIFETLRLLTWLYFKPQTLARHISVLEPERPPENDDANLRSLVRYHRLNLYVQALLLVLPFAWPIAQIVAWTMGNVVNWSGVALGLLFGWVFGVAFGLIFGAAAYIAFGWAVGITLGIAAYITIGVAASVAFGVGVGAAGAILSVNEGLLGIGLGYGLFLGVILGGGFAELAKAAFGRIISLMFGIALGITITIAAGLISGMGVAPSSRGIIDLVAGIVAGLAAGVAANASIGAGQRLGPSIIFGLAVAVVINLAAFATYSVVFGIVFSGVFIVSFLRLYQYPFEALWMLFLWWSARTAPPARMGSLIQAAPYQWDEVIWFPLLGAAELVRLVAKHDLKLGLGEIVKLANNFGQKEQARRALADVTADVLAGITILSTLSTSPEKITWLPEDLKAVRPDLPEVIPALFAAASDLQATGDSPLAQRAALREAVERVDAVQKRLPYLGREGRERWEPVLGQWNKVLVAALQNVTVPAAGQLENPYEVGNPLPPNRKALFKGRAELRASVITALRQQGRVTLVLTGPRRMGKTTFLLQLPALLPSRAIPIYLDVQRPAHTLSDAAFLHALAAAIASGARPYRLIFDPPMRAAFDASPFEAFAQWLATHVYPHLQDFTLLLTLDEFEKAGAALAAGRLTPALFDELRYLIQHEQHLALLFAGVQTLDELGPQWSSYFPNLRQLTIGHLAPPEAEELLRRPDATVEFPLTYSDAAVAHILAQTAAHPYLVQLLGSCVVEEVNRRQVLHADLEIVHAAETLALERGAPFFRNVWDEFTGATPAQVAAGRALLLALARGETFSVSPHAQRLQRYGLLTSDHTLTIPLIARWVRERGEIGD